MVTLTVATSASRPRRATTSHQLLVSLVTRFGVAAVLMEGWVLGPAIPDTTVNAAIFWYLVTAGFVVAVAMWALVPWLKTSQVQAATRTRSGNEREHF